MKISVVQTRSIKGDMLSNLKMHKKLINLAISYSADCIFFPELSVTGYEPEHANELATSPDDIGFNDIQNLSDNNKITIGLSMPTRANSGIHISMMIFQPGAPRQIYSKQQLHSDELSYFIQGEEQVILKIANTKIAPAICYESLQADHSENANKLGAEIYIASVAKAQNGFDKAMIHYPAVARKLSMPVLMANCVGFCDNFESVGKSSVWTKQGILAGQLDDKLEGILIFDTETEKVIKHTL